MNPDFPPGANEVSVFNHSAISDSQITVVNNQTIKTTNILIQETTMARQYMPSKPDIFHGRDSLVEEISHLLCNEPTPRVCILGPGGMGKTSLALAVVESAAVQSKYGSRCYWIPCVDASSSTPFLQTLHTQVCSARTQATNDMLSDILAELKHVEEPTLLLLDNFETPWFPLHGTTKAVDDILFQLHKCSQVTILLTMRLLGNSKGPCTRIKWHTRHLQPVSQEASRFIFHDMYPDSEGDPDVDALLAAVGHMPYAVILMAKSGETCGFTPKMLLEEWKQAGTGMISHSGSPEDDMNKSIGLSVNRNFVQQNPDALLLLQTLALLPVGTSMTNLREWAPNLKALSAIRTLSDAALLLQSDGPPTTPKILSILPVVQSFMQTNTDLIPKDVRHNVLKACHRFILDHISQCEACPQDIESIVITEKRNVHFLLLNADLKSLPFSLDSHVKSVLYFHDRHSQTLDIAEYALSLARQLGDEKTIAQALFKLATGHGQKNENGAAEKYFSECYDLLSKFTDPDSTQDTIQCGLLLVGCRLLLNRPLSAIVEFLQTLPVALDDDFQTALVKCKLGGCLQMHHQLAEALHAFQEAKDLFTRTGHLGKVAETLGNISDVYYLSSQFEKALELILEAREAAEGSGMTRTSNTFIKYKHGRCLCALQRDVEALPIFQECSSVFESAGLSSSAAECFKQMGFLHYRQGSRDDACVAFEGAIAKLTELGVGGDEIRKLEGYIEELKAAITLSN